MKKFIPIAVAVLVGIMTMHAQVPKDTTVIRFNDKRIYVRDSVGEIKVRVFDEFGGEYKTVYEGIFTDNKSYERWTVMEEIGLQLPFLPKSEKKKKFKMEPHYAGVGWGFSNFADQQLNFNHIDGVVLASESSKEFFFNIIEKIIPIYRNNLGITTGLGFNWRNYYLKNNEHFADVNGVTVIQPAADGVNYLYSRLRTHFITIPLLLEWQPTFGQNRKFFVAGGVVGGINTMASHKVKYHDNNGRTVRTVQGKGYNTAPVSVDFMGTVGYGSWSAYAKYAPFSLFQSNMGPEVRPVSVGLMMHF